MASLLDKALKIIDTGSETGGTQLRVGYDGSNYMDVQVASAGSTTFTLTGTSPEFTFAQKVNFSGDVAVSGQVAGNLDLDSSLLLDGVSALSGLVGGSELRVAEGGAITDVRVFANLTVDDDLVVSGTGPHSFGGGTVDYAQVRYTGSFTSGGASTQAFGVHYAASLTAATGDTTRQAYVMIDNAGLTTQGASETITVVSSLHVQEPNITVGTGDTISTAATVFINGVPTEGSNNYSLWVDAGTVRLDGNVGIGGDVAAGRILDITASGDIANFTANSPTWRLTDAQDTTQYAEIQSTAGDIVLKADDAGNKGSSAIRFNIDGTEQVRIPAGTDGFQFGSALDTNLYRSAADTLKTDDSFVAGADEVGAISVNNGSNIVDLGWPGGGVFQINYSGSGAAEIQFPGDGTVDFGSGVTVGGNVRFGSAGYRVRSNAFAASAYIPEQDGTSLSEPNNVGVLSGIGHVVFSIDANNNTSVGSFHWGHDGVYPGDGLWTSLMTLDESGDLAVSGDFTVSGTGPHAIGGATAASIAFYVRGSFTSSGAVNGARFEHDLTPAADTNASGVVIDTTVNEAGSGTHDRFVGLDIRIPTVNAGSATLNTTASLWIEGAPSTSGTDYALWVDAGTTRLDGQLNATFPNTSTGTGLLVATNDGSTQEVFRDSSTLAHKSDVGTVSLEDARRFLAVDAISYEHRGGHRDVGFGAEHVHDAGLEDVVTYVDGEPMGFKSFGRGLIGYHHRLIQDHEERLTDVRTRQQKIEDALRMVCEDPSAENRQAAKALLN